MKKWLLIVLLFFTGYAFAQEDPAELSRRLIRNCTTDKEKTVAIFNWITENISYRVRLPFRTPVIGAASLKLYNDLNNLNDTGALKPLNERVAITVLRKREAICEGYARLFHTLCEYAGVQSVIIAGYARNTLNKPAPVFGVNHYWNAVFFEGDWHLLDATWASGYISRATGEFVQEYDATYFLPNPESFIKDHYPDDIRWTLLPDTKVPKEFYSTPFQQKSFYKYSIVSFSPSKGIIEAAVGDTIRLELATKNAERDKNISPDMLVDSTIFSESDALVFLKPSAADSINPAAINTHRYILPVDRPGIQWVYLMYNEDMVLRYKVNVKR
jgi:transglutaminase/protease-like cytokinesis protein 3